MPTADLVNAVSATGMMSPAYSESGSLGPSAPVASSPFSALVVADDLTPFERERAAFHRALPDLLRTQPGKYVVVSGGRVVAVGESENETVRRFCREHPDADFYIGFVGDEPLAYQIRPASR